MSIYGLLLRSKLPGLFGDPLQPNLTAPPPYPVGGIRAPAPPLSLMGPGPGSPAGLLVPGNIDLAHRPVVRNRDGSISTVRSISVNVDGREVLIPTVSDDGRILSNAQAVAEFRRTGRHLGMFRDPGSATQYAQRLHEQQAQMYAQPNAGLPTRSPDTVPVSPPIPALAAGPRGAPVPPTAPPVVQGGADPRGIAGVLSRIFAGQGDPNLSPEQNRRAARQAMLRAGLATLAASSDGEHPGLSAVAAGALYGQQSGDQARQAERKQQQAAALQSMMDGGLMDADRLRQMALHAYATGDYQGAQVLGSMAGQMGQGEGLMEVKDAQGQTHLVNRRTGEDVRTIAGAPDLESYDRGDAIVFHVRNHPDQVTSVVPKAIAGQTVQTAQGAVSVNPITGEARAVVGPDGQPLRQTSEKETERITAARSALGSLSSFRDMVRQYAALPAEERAIAAAGFGPSAPLVASLRAAHGVLAIQGKTVAQLGALSGGDLDLVNQMFSDPSAGLNIIRDPNNALARLDQAQRWLESQSRTTNEIVGGGLPVPGGRVISDMHDTRDGGTRSHDGVDEAAPRGSPVVAPPLPGGVLEITEGVRGGRGVTVRYPDHSWIFLGHFDSYAPGIRNGAPVTPSQLIGTVGNSGNARDTVPHVHFQAHNGRGKLVDPRTFYAQPQTAAPQYDQARANARALELRRIGRSNAEILATLRDEKLIP